MGQLSLHIDDLAFGGSGVGRSGGKAVFVPFTISGEEVTAQIVKEKKSFAEAELLSVEKTSPHRIVPRCPYFGRCGGCSYQHLAYPEQLAAKQRQVEQTLRRLGRLTEVPMQPIIASPKSYGYRNRIRVHAADGIVGFYAQDGHTLLDIEMCPIASPAVNAALHTLRHRQPLREGDHTAAEGAAGYFRQTNDLVAPLMLQHVEELLHEDQGLLVDAYCGAGLFTKHLAPFFREVVGIEENEFAVKLARENAWPNERYLIGDVAAHLSEVLAQETPSRTTLLLDPPSRGLEEEVCEVIMECAPIEVVYVSCDPATLARDLGILCRMYRLSSVTPVDMFPQTAEIEVVAHLDLRT